MLMCVISFCLFFQVSFTISSFHFSFSGKLVTLLFFLPVLLIQGLSFDWYCEIMLLVASLDSVQVFVLRTVSWRHCDMHLLW